MALTEIPIELSSTPSIVDGGNATAITIGLTLVQMLFLVLIRLTQLDTQK